MPPTDDQIRELVRRFTCLEVNGWDEAAFDHARAHLGWSPAQYSAREQEWAARFPNLRRGEEYDTGLGTGRGSFTRSDTMYDRPSIQVRVGQDDDLFRSLRSALEESLGSPSIMRGPGPLLRWRGSDRLLELERIRGSSYLAVRPTEAVEADEYQTAKWAESEDGLGQLGYWQVTGRGPEMMGTFIPGGYWVDSWEKFQEELAETLRSVVQDFTLLDGPGHFTVVVHTPGDRRFVQWTTHDPDWTLEIQAAIPPNADSAWKANMAEAGWLAASDPSVKDHVLVRLFPDLDMEGAATASRMLVDALCSYDVPFEDLWHQVISPDVRLLGIGLPTHPGGRV
ncbi:hypothetical protein ACFVH6_09570 [Spirillospora sp. NPDC127200]